MKIKRITIILSTVLLVYWPTQYILAYSLSGWPTFTPSKEETSVVTDADTPTSVATDNKSDLFSNRDTAASASLQNDILAANDNTPETYRPPQYDPFNNKYRPRYDYVEVLGPVTDKLDTPPLADFNVTPDRSGFGDNYTGTTATIFTFSGGMVSDKETSAPKLEVRFDFESDGKWNSFFSYTKTQNHQFKTPGIYKVTMEVLDKGGNVSSVTKTVTVVENTAPMAFFTFKPVTATNGSIFTFDTSKSGDSQYLRQYLKYRFDWDSDGRFDTPYDTKTGWKHIFGTTGAHKVTMEVMDPEGLTAQTSAEITTFQNTAPTALLSIGAAKGIKNKYFSGADFRVNYAFDASSSSDAETSKNKLLFRWDFNNTGKDDIVFDTGWSNNPKNNGFYAIPGKKVIRLQVKDADGAVSDAYAQIEVPSADPGQS
jgi:hypothetical protein